MEALDHLVRSGKVRYIGVSNFSAWHLMKAMGIAERRYLARPISQQIHYTLQAREAEYELVPASLDQGLGIMVWSPLAGGLLSGRHRRGQATPEGTRQLAEWTEPPIRDTDALYDIVEALVSVAEARGISAAQVALAWLLTRPAVSTVIMGARTNAQLADDLKSADLIPTWEKITTLETVSRPPLLYPYWHQAQTASDGLSEEHLTLLRPHLKA